MRVCVCACVFGVCVSMRVCLHVCASAYGGRLVVCCFRWGACVHVRMCVRVFVLFYFSSKGKQVVLALSATAYQAGGGSASWLYRMVYCRLIVKIDVAICTKGVPSLSWGSS